MRGKTEQLGVKLSVDCSEGFTIAAETRRLSCAGDHLSPGLNLRRTSRRGGHPAD